VQYPPFVRVCAGECELMPKNILMVDDSATSLLMNRIVITKKTPHEVLTADNGPEWRKHLESRELEPSSICRKLSALSSFLYDCLSPAIPLME
jgi:hypothetical protein